MPSFAFFDLDHTLLPFDTQTLFANYILQQDRGRIAYLVRFAPIALLRAAKLIPTVTAKRAFMGYMQGMTRQELTVHARHFAQTIVRPWAYPELMTEVARHRDAGRTLILNTASPDVYAHEIARVLGFDHCIATRVKEHDRMPFLPVVMGSNNKREAKIAAMKLAIPAVAEATPEELKNSWAYSDSAADLPLLELAGHGVLVHPNAALEAIGKQKGWLVMRPKRPYEGKAGDVWSSARQALGLYREPAAREP
ncbi:MAG TPA: HAD-IB family hydrolase [Verrucomicrobium sp.]|nr:HAD-IB family hydrolase [Verrucomicrobium sp.]